jgi:tetrahedral aminopeptidase
METAGLVRELTEASGPSGYEAGIRGTVRRLLAPYVHDTGTDAMGNLVAIRRGEGQGFRPTLMIAAHMDEIALMVTQVEKGFLRFTGVGGFDPRVLPGQEVVVNARRPLPGVIVSVPPHFTDPAEREKPFAMDRLFIDVGLPPAEVDGLVKVGDLVTLGARFTTLAGGLVACKAMDDRASVAAMILALEEISRARTAWDVAAVATVQEEVTMAGAYGGAWGLDPAAAVVLDVTFGLQPGVSGPEAVKLDAGPGIAVGPNFHPALVDRLTATARQKEIPHQVEVLAGGSGTDAWAIQVTRTGIPCGLLSIPLRSMHTTVETVCLRDIERTARLLAAFVIGLDAGFAAAFSVRDALAGGTGAA